MDDAEEPAEEEEEEPEDEEGAEEGQGTDDLLGGEGEGADDRPEQGSPAPEEDAEAPGSGSDLGDEPQQHSPAMSHDKPHVRPTPQNPGWHLQQGEQALEASPIHRALGPQEASPCHEVSPPHGSEQGDCVALASPDTNALAAPVTSASLDAHTQDGQHEEDRADERCSPMKHASQGRLSKQSKGLALQASQQVSVYAVVAI